MFAWLRRLVRKQSYPKTVTRVILYTRSGCHLCDDAWQLLLQEQHRRNYSLETVDIDTDPKLREEFDRLVPVVTVNGKVRFRGRVNPVLLRRLLRRLN